MGERFDLSTKNAKQMNTTKKTQISRNVFRYYLKERELDEDQLVSSKVVRAFFLYLFARVGVLPELKLIEQNKFSGRNDKTIIRKKSSFQRLAHQLFASALGFGR